MALKVLDLCADLGYLLFCFVSKTGSLSLYYVALDCTEFAKYIRLALNSQRLTSAGIKGVHHLICPVHSSLRLALNPWKSCLSLLSAEVTGVSHNAYYGIHLGRGGVSEIFL